MTVVQAKRYNSKPITFEAVAALAAVVDDEQANRVATSRYLPSAKGFAARRKKKIVLATKGDVATWCGQALSRIANETSRLVDSAELSALMRRLREGEARDRVVCGERGYNCTFIVFAVVLRESRNNALMLKLPNSYPTGNIWQGSAIPDFGVPAGHLLSEGGLFRASRDDKGALGLRYRGDPTSFYPWDGLPVHFNGMD